MWKYLFVFSVIRAKQLKFANLVTSHLKYKNFYCVWIIAIIYDHFSMQLANIISHVIFPFIFTISTMYR